MSTPPVISLVDRLPSALANREAVEILEHHLELAKAGKIKAVALAAVLDNGMAQTACSAADSATMLLGAIGRLWHRFNMECAQEGPPAA
jgi:hypothetical protein